MEEQKESNIIGFDDTNDEKDWERILRKSRESKELNNSFFEILIKRIDAGLTTYQHELNSLPKKYKEKFGELYKNYQKK